MWTVVGNVSVAVEMVIVALNISAETTDKSMSRRCLRSSLFCGFTQRRLVATYRRFETNYRSHLQESSGPRILGLSHPWRWDPIDCPETSVCNVTLHCVKSQKSAHIVDISAGAWNHARPLLLLKDYIPYFKPFFGNKIKIPFQLL